MGKLNTTPRITQKDPVLIRELREHATQVNLLSEGKLSAAYNAATAAPTTGTWSHGDFVRNSDPAEQNTGGLKYFVFGWECLVGGTPGTWAEMRFLTGSGVNVTKLLTATETLDFPSIASNDTHELTITVNGASVGDTVLLAAPSTLETGLGFSGIVTAANTVTIRLHNSSGVGINPASAIWRATVMTIA